MDSETTGLDPKRNDIIQLSIIIEIDNEIKHKEKFNIQPFDYTTIEPKALETNKLTIEQIKTFENPKDVYRKIIKIFDTYIDKYDKKDKFIASGYNVRFDMDFLREFFIKNGDKYFGSYVDYHFLDGMALVFLMRYMGKLNLENYRLETSAKHYGIDINAHDSMSDIEATRELILKITQEIK
jgi:DNA polymerase-3 subunit epsilon